MKIYTDQTGKFQMLIPIEWEYKNPALGRRNKEGEPQAFGLYDSLLGAFQISCKQVTDHIEQLIKTRHEPIQSSDSKQLIFSELKEIAGDNEVNIFSCAVDDHYFFSTYIIPKKHRNQPKYKDELANVKKALSTIKFIKPEFRNHVKDLKRFDLFMSSLAATVDLKNLAIEHGSFIEYVVLSANRIDALLRLSIILTKQNENKNSEIDTKLLLQGEDDKTVMERTIYKIVYDKNIIDKDTYDELDDLYKLRNKVIHRYIISDIRTQEIYKIAIKYYNTEQKISDIVNVLEKYQSDNKIGIYANNPNLGEGFSEISMKELRTKIRDKHGMVLPGSLSQQIKNSNDKT